MGTVCLTRQARVGLEQRYYSSWDDPGTNTSEHHRFIANAWILGLGRAIDVSVAQVGDVAVSTPSLCGAYPSDQLTAPGRIQNMHVCDISKVPRLLVWYYHRS